MNEPSEATKNRAEKLSREYFAGPYQFENTLNTIVIEALMAERAEVDAERLAERKRMTDEFAAVIKSTRQSNGQYAMNAAKAECERAEIHKTLKARELTITRFNDQVVSLREQRDEAIQEMNKSEQHQMSTKLAFERKEKECNAAEQERDRLRASLVKYGDHAWNCPSRCGCECACGYSEALNQKGGQSCATLHNPLPDTTLTTAEIVASKATPDVRPIGSVAIICPNGCDAGFNMIDGCCTDCCKCGAVPIVRKSVVANVEAVERKVHNPDILSGETKTPKSDAKYRETDNLQDWIVFCCQLERDGDVAKNKLNEIYLRLQESRRLYAESIKDIYSLRTQIKSLEVDKARLFSALFKISRTPVHDQLDMAIRDTALSAIETTTIP